MEAVLGRVRKLAVQANTPPGRSALDAVELMNDGWNMKREHLPTTQRSQTRPVLRWSSHWPSGEGVHSGSRVCEAAASTSAGQAMDHSSSPNRTRCRRRQGTCNGQDMPGVSAAGPQT